MLGLAEQILSASNARLFTGNEITLYLLLLYVNFVSEKEYLYLNIFLLVKLIVYYNLVNFALLKNELSPFMEIKFC